MNSKEYLPILLYTGLHNDRVHPAHALKFVAVLEDIMAFIYNSLGMNVK
jgi:prolyl oligopeptidase